MCKATIHLLANVGYAETTIAGVAQDAGFSKGAVQYHFPTKEELIAVFETLKDESALHYQLVPYILLATGCRLNEAVQLRTTDLKQSESGLWCIDWIVIHPVCCWLRVPQRCCGS